MTYTALRKHHVGVGTSYVQDVGRIGKGFRRDAFPANDPRPPMRKPAARSALDAALSRSPSYLRLFSRYTGAPGKVFQTLTWGIPYLLPPSVALPPSGTPGVSYVAGQYQWFGGFSARTTEAAIPRSDRCAIPSNFDHTPNSLWVGIYLSNGIACSARGEILHLEEIIPPRDYPPNPKLVRWPRDLPQITGDPAPNSEPGLYPGFYKKTDDEPLFEGLPGRDPRGVVPKNISIQISPGRVTVKRNIPAVRPPRGVKERKVVMSPRLLGILNFITEGLDFIDVLIEATGVKHPKFYNIFDRYQFLIEDGNLAKLDFAKFLELYAWEQFEDMVWGKLSKKAAKGFFDAFDQLGLDKPIFGPSTGLAL